MSLPSSIEPHDFEIVASPEKSTDLPENPTPTPVTDNAKSIQDLFDKPSEPLFVQTLAKVVILVSIPHQIMWSAVTAIFVAVCQPTPNDDTPLDQLVLRQITLHTEDRLAQTRKRLDWVDKELPAVVEKCDNHVKATAKQMSSAKNKAVTQASPAIVGTSRLAILAVAAPIVSLIILPRSMWMMKAPIWIWLGLGYWFGKRRERRRQNRYGSVWQGHHRCSHS